MVLLIHGYRADEQDEEFSAEAIRLLGLLTKELPLKKAAAIVAEMYEVKKNALYKWGLENL